MATRRDGARRTRAGSRRRTRAAASQEATEPAATEPAVPAVAPRAAKRAKKGEEEAPAAAAGDAAPPPPRRKSVRLARKSQAKRAEPAPAPRAAAAPAGAEGGGEAPRPGAAEDDLSPITEAPEKSTAPEAPEAQAKAPPARAPAPGPATAAPEPGTYRYEVDADDDITGALPQLAALAGGAPELDAAARPPRLAAMAEEEAPEAGKAKVLTTLVEEALMGEIVRPVKKKASPPSGAPQPAAAKGPTAAPSSADPGSTATATRTPRAGAAAAAGGKSATPEELAKSAIKNTEKETRSVLAKAKGGGLKNMAELLKPSHPGLQATPSPQVGSLASGAPKPHVSTSKIFKPVLADVAKPSAEKQKQKPLIDVAFLKQHLKTPKANPKGPVRTPRSADGGQKPHALAVRAPPLFHQKQGAGGLVPKPHALKGKQRERDEVLKRKRERDELQRAALRKQQEDKRRKFEENRAALQAREKARREEKERKKGDPKENSAPRSLAAKPGAGKAGLGDATRNPLASMPIMSKARGADKENNKPSKWTAANPLGRSRLGAAAAAAAGLSSQKAAVVSNPLANRSNAQTPPTAKPVHAGPEVESYEMSPYRGSDDEDEDGGRKPVPAWAQKQNLLSQLKQQRYADPDEIFKGQAVTASLDEVFGNGGGRRHRWAGKGRGSSGNWEQDAVTKEEELHYKRAMGFLRV